MMSQTDFVKFSQRVYYCLKDVFSPRKSSLDLIGLAEIYLKRMLPYYDLVDVCCSSGALGIEL